MRFAVFHDKNKLTDISHYALFASLKGIMHVVFFLKPDTYSDQEYDLFS